MKKTLFVLLAVVFTTSSVLVFNACDEDDSPLGCVQLALEYSQATVNFNADDTNANCVTLKNAAQDYIDGCSTLTDDQEAAIQAVIDGLNCQ